MIKNKKSWFWFIPLMGILLWGIWFIFSEIPLKNIYIYKRGTDIPLSNQPVEITYEPFCTASPCYGPKRTYEGYTQADGSFRISLQDALRIQTGIKQRYADYFIRISNFYSPPSTIVTDAKSRFDISLTEHRSPEEPFQIDLGQEFNISSPLSVNEHFTLQFSDIDLETQTAELKLLLTSLWEDPVVQTFTLKKDVPSYIPREITDSQLVLTDIGEKQITLNFLPKSSLTAWNEREVDFSPEMNMNDQKYLHALAYFKEVEAKFENVYGEKVKLAPFDHTSGHAYSAEAIGPVNNDSIWLNDKELPKELELCLVSSFYVVNDSEDLDNTKEGKESIIPCLPSERGIYKIDEPLDF